MIFFKKVDELKSRLNTVGKGISELENMVEEILSMQRVKKTEM